MIFPSLMLRGGDRGVGSKPHVQALWPGNVGDPHDDHKPKRRQSNA
jgi:hypothetical protein